MRFLFICRANVGRSQIAAALYNKLHGNYSDSAGTHVDGNHGYNGQPLNEFAREFGGGAEHVITVLEEDNIDVSQMKRVQLTPEMMNSYDQVIVMADKKDCPDYLLRDSKVTFWDVEDVKGKDLEFIRNIREEIRGLLQTLIQ